MDDNAKHAASYQLDQEILDARGIKMTVEEVAGLPTCKYSERVHSLKLNDEDLAFLKGLRRRIKNRLASQNSRRRSVEHLRRLTRELRAVRACRHDALAERRALLASRDAARGKCAALRRHVQDVLEDRADTTEIPSIDIERKEPKTKIKPVAKKKSPLQDCFEKLEKLNSVTEITEKNSKRRIKKEFLDNCQTKNGEVLDSCQLKSEFSDNCQLKSEFLDTCQLRNEFSDECQVKNEFLEERNEILDSLHDNKIDGNLFECKIGKLVQQSVNHLYKEKKKVFAKTVFIANEKLSSDISSVVFENEVNQRRCNEEVKEECQVLNLCVKEGRRKSHGRKQLAPRRIAYFNCDDGVLDLKIKKEAQ